MLGEVGAALWAELLKVRRSLVPWVSLAAFTLAGVVGALFMFVWVDPQRARALGLLGAKAQLATGTADWAGYLALVAQIVAVGGLLVFGMVSIWLFGREFSDGTLTDLLALPTSRSAIVVAKLLVAAGWCLALTAYVTTLSLASGLLLALPGWSASVATLGLRTIALTAALTIALTTAYALVASLGRGYLSAIAAMFFTLFAAQVITALGYGEWFPWSVPALLSGIAGREQGPPGLLGAAGVVIVGIAGALGTAWWWERADHNR